MLTGALILAAALAAADWTQFRGPNGTGYSSTSRFPEEFGPQKNVVWKTAIPFGHSSPIVVGHVIFVTGAEGGARADAGREKVVDEGGKLFTIAIDRKSGKILWRREAPRPRLERYQPTNSPASPTPVSDGKSVFVFFGDYGLLSYGLDGNERWRAPLGPFNNVNGHGSSPILFENLLILVCDQDTESYMIAVDKNTGRERWRVQRPETTRTYVTPAVIQPEGKPAELIVPGAYQVAGYNIRTGEKLWWVRGFSWQPKSLPIVDGEMIFAHGWEGGGEAESPTETPTFAETLAKYDANKDKLLTPKEFHDDPRMQKAFYNIDLDSGGTLDERDWEFYRARRSARNSLLAIRHGGSGDLTRSNVLWSMQKFLPNCPSPLLYQGVLYLIKDGGILTSLDPKTGKILKQGRLPGALDTYYSSPVGADGKVLLISQQGKATVLKAAGEWEVLASIDLEEEAYATPAIVDDKLYLRTRNHLYCFAR